MPNVLVIAGPNGAGKTTTGINLLKILNTEVQINNFVNADTIAQGFSPHEPEKVAIEASRTMLKKIDSLANEKQDFAFETTLASRTFAPKIIDWKKAGYHFYLIFLFLDSAELAIARVEERIKIGGHSVPEKTIRRRYINGLKNFFNLYSEIADSWRLYNNSNQGVPVPIAAKTSDTLKIQQPLIWQTLVEEYHGKS